MSKYKTYVGAHSQWKQIGRCLVSQPADSILDSAQSLSACQATVSVFAMHWPLDSQSFLLPTEMQLLLDSISF